MARGGSVRDPLDLLFLGTGNAFAAEGNAFNSFLANNRILFDAGPTLLQQMRRAHAETKTLDVVFISHFHADHFFGMPFLFLDFWREDRRRDLFIVGPPGIEERTEMLFETGFPGMPPIRGLYKRRYIEVADGMEAEAGGVQFTAAEVEHVPALRCFSYRAHIGGRALLYSGDSRLCPGLLKLAPAADILVLDCNASGDPVHLGQDEIPQVMAQAGPEAVTIVSHLDCGADGVTLPGVLVASDLGRFRI